MATETFVPPTLARGAGSYCALAGDVLDNPHYSPRIDGGGDFNADCQRIAAGLERGERQEFGFGCLTAFDVVLIPRGSVTTWPSYVPEHFVGVEITIGPVQTGYWHPLGKSGNWDYIAEKHRLKEHDARAIDYLLSAVGEASGVRGGDHER